MIEEYGKTFFERAKIAKILVPNDTWLFRPATDVIEMTQAYASDGFVFLKNHDEVNALASFAYGNGWLDAGVKEGLLASLPAGIPPLNSDQDIPENLFPHLEEKTFRYERMLTSALASVSIHSEPELPLYPAGEELCRIARLHYITGTDEIQKNNLADGLAFLSYAYGWVDAGVRTGILKVIKNHELFTI